MLVRRPSVLCNSQSGQQSLEAGACWNAACLHQTETPRKPMGQSPSASHASLPAAAKRQARAVSLQALLAALPSEYCDNIRKPAHVQVLLRMLQALQAFPVELVPGVTLREERREREQPSWRWKVSCRSSSSARTQSANPSAFPCSPLSCLCRYMCLARPTISSVRPSSIRVLTVCSPDIAHLSQLFSCVILSSSRNVLSCCCGRRTDADRLGLFCASH